MKLHIIIRYQKNREIVKQYSFERLYVYTASNTDNCFSLRTSPTFLRHGFLLYDEYFTKKSRYFSIYFFREVENYNVEDSSYLFFSPFA